MAVFEGKKSSNDLVFYDTMSDDEEVASDVPPRYLFLIICKEAFTSVHGRMIFVAGTATYN